MSSSAADRIRAMQEKGILTPEQAEELLGAVSGGGPGAEPAQQAGAVGASQAGRAAEDSGAAADGDDPADAGEGFEPHGSGRPPRSFFDMGWMDGMVDGINAGLGISSTSRSGKGRSHKYRYDYHYEWEPGRSAGSWNDQRTSRVEQPEGDSFEFRDNRLSFSELKGIKLVRSRMKDNSFSASTLRGAELTDAVMENCSLTGASIHDLFITDGSMKKVALSGTKMHAVHVRGRSSMKDTKIYGSGISQLTLDGESVMEDTVIAGGVLNTVTLDRASSLKDCRLKGVTATRLTLEGSRIDDARLQGCMLMDTRLVDSEPSGGAHAECRHHRIAHERPSHGLDRFPGPGDPLDDAEESPLPRSPRPASPLRGEAVPAGMHDRRLRVHRMHVQQYDDTGGHREGRADSRRRLHGKDHRNGGRPPGTFPTITCCPDASRRGPSGIKNRGGILCRGFLLPAKSNKLIVN